MIRSSHDKMRFYFGKDNNTFLDLGPEDTIDIVPTGKVLTGVQWDGGRARWQATYWDGKRMACKSFPIQTYGGDSEKAKAAAQEFQARLTGPHPARPCCGHLRVCDDPFPLCSSRHYLPTTAGTIASIFSWVLAGRRAFCFSVDYKH